MTWFRTPILAKLFFPGIWKGEANTIYLTFDDGPHEEITPWVLSLLDKYQVKATFFCVGQNIEKNFDLFHEIKSKGHRLGNHTFEHLRGRNTANKAYLDSIEKTEKHTQSNLFRPPYGSIKKAQLKMLQNLGYKTVFWTWLSHDFDSKVASNKIIRASNRIKGGDILVFHDSKKAEQNLKASLEIIIKNLISRGFSFDVVPL